MWSNIHSTKTVTKRQWPVFMSSVYNSGCLLWNALSSASTPGISVRSDRDRRELIAFRVFDKSRCKFILDVIRSSSAGQEYEAMDETWTAVQYYGWRLEMDGWGWKGWRWRWEEDVWSCWYCCKQRGGGVECPHWWNNWEFCFEVHAYCNLKTTLH